MNYQEFIPLFKKQAYALPYRRQLEFAIIISNKLLPEYKTFFEFHGWGNLTLLMDAINFIENSLTNSIDNQKIKELKAKIDPIIPHMDDFGDNIGSYALCASAAIYEALDFLLDNDQDHIYNIGIYYTDTIDFKIQEEEDLTDEQIDKHPLMIQAWNYIIELTR